MRAEILSYGLLPLLVGLFSVHCSSSKEGPPDGCLLSCELAKDAGGKPECRCAAEQPCKGYAKFETDGTTESCEAIPNCSIDTQICPGCTGYECFSDPAYTCAQSGGTWAAPDCQCPSGQREAKGSCFWKTCFYEICVPESCEAVENNVHCPEGFLLDASGCPTTDCRPQRLAEGQRVTWTGLVSRQSDGSMFFAPGTGKCVVDFRGDIFFVRITDTALGDGLDNALIPCVSGAFAWIEAEGVASAEGSYGPNGRFNRQITFYHVLNYSSDVISAYCDNHCGP